MTKGRLEAFSDGVLAIIITIMVLELKVPHGDDWQTLVKLWPIFVSYVLSFIYVGIYWNNHHHLFAASHRIDGTIMWTNLHLLFWLSLIPFVTGWMGENHFAALPTALYGFVLLMAAIAYWVLQGRILAKESASSALRAQIGSDLKGKISPFLYIAGIATSFFAPWLAWALFAFVAFMWLVPDRRFERAVRQGKAE
jgi:TMEM175 potassium channel family protein